MSLRILLNSLYYWSYSRASPSGSGVKLLRLGLFSSNMCHILSSFCLAPSIYFLILPSFASSFSRFSCRGSLGLHTEWGVMPSGAILLCSTDRSACYFPLFQGYSAKWLLLLPASCSLWALWVLLFVVQICLVLEFACTLGFMLNACPRYYYLSLNYKLSISQITQPILCTIQVNFYSCFYRSSWRRNSFLLFEPITCSSTLTIQFMSAGKLNPIPILLSITNRLKKSLHCIVAQVPQ